MKETGTGQKASKNDIITMAVAGINGQGKSHLQCFSAIKGVRIKTICEVDERIWPAALNFAEKCGSSNVKLEADIRRVLDDPDIDAISVATPNHWHSLMAIWACQAGKDVYVEKPVSHNIFEGRQAVKAARRYGRIVVAGMQQRSFPHVQEAMRLLQQGVIGEVHRARALCFKPRGDIGRKAERPVPDGLHYDLWLGPATYRPFTENYVHYNWHWFWDFGNGDIGNQGVHEMDTARWGLGKTSLPRKVYSSGGLFSYDCDQETPNCQIATFQWEDGKVLNFEVRGLDTNEEQGMSIGNLFYGSLGWMKVDIDGFQTFLGRHNEPGPAMNAVVDQKRTAIGGPKGFIEGNAHETSRFMHRENFIQAIRRRTADSVFADIEEGHLSSALCHLANISYRLKRQLLFDPGRERFVNDDQADHYLTRSYRYPFIVPDDL